MNFAVSVTQKATKRALSEGLVKITHNRSTRYYILFSASFDSSVGRAQDCNGYFAILMSLVRSRLEGLFTRLVEYILDVLDAISAHLYFLLPRAPIYPLLVDGKLAFSELGSLQG